MGRKWNFYIPSSDSTKKFIVVTAGLWKNHNTDDEQDLRLDILYTCRDKYRSCRHFTYMSLELTLDLTFSNQRL
jgi:hypothetical protein